MRTVRLLVVLLFFVLAIRADQEQEKEELYKQKWLAWLERYGKHYTEPSEIARAYQCYVENRDAKEAFAAMSPTAEFHMGVDPYADMCENEFVRDRAGGHRHEESRTPEEFLTQTKNSSKFLMQEVAASKDWRTAGINPVQDQKSCGSCWSYATVAALELNYAIATGGTVVKLSEQEVLSCSGAGNCPNGGYPGQAVDWLVQNGATLKSDYGQHISWGYYDNHACTWGNRKPFIKVARKITVYGEQNYLQHLSSVGPLIIALDMTRLRFYSSGILTNCPVAPSNHIMTLVGYGRDNGMDYWIVRNSWGPQWGEQGYIRMQRNVNSCGMAKYSAYSPEPVKTNTNPTNPTNPQTKWTYFWNTAGSGGNVEGQMYLTLADAKRRCEANTNCKGFHYSGNSVDFTGSVYFTFKNSNAHYQANGWVFFQKN